MEIIETNLDFGPMTPRSMSNVNETILHHAGAENCSVYDIHQWHKNNGWAGIGYNFFIRKDGSVWEGRPLEYVPAHCSGHNSTTIGVCFEGNFEYEWMPEAQINAGKEMVAYIRDNYGINKFSKHKDYNSTDCPGQNFPFDEIVNGQPSPGPEPQPTPSGNETIIAIQNWCNDNYATDIDNDGFYGPKTKWALTVALQTELNNQFGAGLNVDGIFGTATKNACRNIKKGDKGNITQCIQSMLWCKGYDPAGIDGMFGNGTQSAVKAFQISNGLSSDGIVGKNTFAKLFG